MLGRLRIAFLLIRVLNPKPSAHRPAMARLKGIGESAMKRVLKSAVQTELAPHRSASTLCKPQFQELVQKIPPAEGLRQVTRILEMLADEIPRRAAQRDRFGEILADIGEPAWDMMLDLAAKYAETNYVQTAYFLIPQFVNKIPPEKFAEAAQTHSVEAIRNQATIYLQRFQPHPQDLLEKLAEEHQALLKMEWRYGDLLKNTLRHIYHNYDSLGLVVLRDLWQHPNLTLRNAALDITRYSDKIELLDHYLAMTTSPDAKVQENAVYGLWFLLFQQRCSEEQKQQVYETAKPLLDAEGETLFRASLVIEILCQELTSAEPNQCEKRIAFSPTSSLKT